MAKQDKIPLLNNHAPNLAGKDFTETELLLLAGVGADRLEAAGLEAVSPNFSLTKPFP